MGDLDFILRRRARVCTEESVRRLAEASEREAKENKMFVDQRSARRRRIMAAVDSGDDVAVEREVDAALRDGEAELAKPEPTPALDRLLDDVFGVNARINKTRVKIEGDTSDGRTLYFEVRLNPATNMLEAVDGLGTVWASAITIEGLAQKVYGCAVPQHGDDDVNERGTGL